MCARRVVFQAFDHAKHAQNNDDGGNAGNASSLAPRTGTITVLSDQSDGKSSSTAGTQKLLTPTSLVCTRRASAHLLENDRAQKAYRTNAAVCVPITHFPGEKYVAGIQSGGIREFANLRAAPVVVATCDDPIRSEYSYSQTTNKSKGFYRLTPFGWLSLQPNQVRTIANAIKPDVLALPIDDVPPAAGKRRRETAVSRTHAWLTETLDDGELEGDVALLAGLTGGTDEVVRARAAKLTMEAVRASSACSRVVGVTVGGLAHGYSADTTKAMLTASLEAVPESMVRYAPGLGAPDDVLRAVASGVDLFDGAYPLTCASDGYALTFPLTAQAARDATHEVDASASAGVDVGSDASKMNLRAVAYRTDARPLVVGCTCEACSRPYTRAYIHHLLNVHELLGEMLLEVHNAHHYSLFFEEMRRTVDDNSFDDFANAHFAYRSAHA